jgi:hypothetical protein
VGLNGASGDLGRELAARRAHRRRRGAGGDVRWRREPRLRDRAAQRRGRGLSRRAGQGAEDDQGEIRADVTLAEAHAQLAWRGLQLRGLYAMGWLDDAARLSALQADGVVLGSRTRGGYLEAAYDVLGLALPDSGQSLSPFVRYEVLDLHDEVPSGLARDPALDQTLWTAGLTYKPIPTVVVKADYQRTAEADSTAEQVNFGVGYVF